MKIDLKNTFFTFYKKFLHFLYSFLKKVNGSFLWKILKIRLRQNLVKIYSYYQNFKDNPNLLIKKIQNYFFSLEEKIKELYSFPHKNNFRSILSIIAICFLSLSILSASNPFYLFVPSLSFPKPSFASETKTKIYLFKKSSERMEEVSMKSISEKDLPLLAKVKLVATRIHKESENLDYLSFPLLGNAITKVWRVEKEKKLIMNMDSYILNNETLLSQKVYKTNLFIKIFMKCLAKSLFEIEEDIEEIEFWLDDKKYNFQKSSL